MKRLASIIDGLLVILVILLLNANTLINISVYHHPDTALFESMRNGEDEMRYLAKIREASEGRWLMANPFLKEHRGEFFSPSGFVEWIPASIMRVLNGNMGLMLLLTDLLLSAITIILTRLWLGRLIKNPWILWSAMLLLFFNHLGGSLESLLRDVVPKFVQPLASLYLLLLTLPTRNTLRQTMLRGALVGCMFYTYPYHWSLFLITEGVFTLYRTWTGIGTRTWTSTAKILFKESTAVLVPFGTIAAPMAFAMHTVLSRPEFQDFYNRYHIVFTHLPAAPKLQAIVLLAIAALLATMWFLKKKQKIEHTELLPLLLPLVGMMILLNANVITGKDPELLGHGGRVIMSVVVAAFAAIASRIIPKRVIQPIAAIFLVLFIGHTIEKKMLLAQEMNTAELQWNVSDEHAVLQWLNEHVAPESIIAAPRILSEKIPVFTSHYTQFAAGAHFFFVPMDELVDRYLGWVGLYPHEKELTDTATVILFGSHPGGQWSKDRTWAKLTGQPFTKSQADYISRQDLRVQIDREHAEPDDEKTAERIERYSTDVIVMPKDGHVIPALMKGFTKVTVIGPYTIWLRKPSNAPANL